MLFQHKHRVGYDLCILTSALSFAAFTLLLRRSNFAYVHTLLVNVCSASLMVYDYRQMRQGRYRVSESYLLLMVLLGGHIGVCISMLILRHKWKKMSFVILTVTVSLVSCFIVHKLRHQPVIW